MYLEIEVYPALYFGPVGLEDCDRLDEVVVLGGVDGNPIGSWLIRTHGGGKVEVSAITHSRGAGFKPGSVPGGPIRLRPTQHEDNLIFSTAIGAT